ncbi:hypothetical protein LX81_00376 [Palleronia aestuarii]|uniref:Phosphatidate cytidylyltransferase n=1 Tax=Palleronia aestuarii TaxID=568105 RepID=A0A2W7P977_9RHOB|nr:UDP-2,3-diacylglucosamine diphosphatase LpxI [Palleronia aestuarii]PZX19912.1 hypothetical protein LX81_00376 [Palleronia aestuarii]
MSLCLIAGQGRLPRLIAERRPDAHLAALEGFAPDGLGPVESFRLETLGTFLAGLRARGVDTVCFAGAIQRPSVDPSRIDAATLPLVPRIAAAMGQGDDAALRAVLATFEEAGIAPVGADAILPDLLPPEGVLGAIAPDDTARKDAVRGMEVVSRLGAADIGQGCVVARGQVLAVEALPGTDWMLASLAAARGDGALARDLPAGGTFVKAPKPGQDRRIDLPTIGIETVAAASRAGLSGITIAAGGVLVLDREALVAEADAAGLFVWIRG